MADIYWITFPTGILIASVVSSIGLGGGVLWMPFFLIVMGLSPETAVVTSLMIQSVGMASGSPAFVKQKSVDFRLGLSVMVVAFPGIVLGAFLANYLNSRYMEIILGVLVMTTAFLFVSAPERYGNTGNERADLKTAWRYSWVTLPASVLSGMLSISMSEWLIPLMRSKLAMKMKNAIGASIFIAFGVCLFGSLVHLIIGGRPHASLVAWAAPGVFIGGQIGPRFTRKINERKLKEIFIFLLTLIGIHLIYNAV